MNGHCRVSHPSLQLLCMYVYTDCVPLKLLDVFSEKWVRGAVPLCVGEGGVFCVPQTVMSLCPIECFNYYILVSSEQKFKTESNLYSRQLF
jgi:hypothetical protein